MIILEKGLLVKLHRVECRYNCINTNNIDSNYRQSSTTMCKEEPTVLSL